MKLTNSIVDIEGIRVGQSQDETALTGCTVILCEKGAIGGVDQRGGAPGTRETDLLRPMHLVEKVHAIVLTGGSAFGLDAATGVMRYLEERKIGFNTGVAYVPIVPAAVIFDLAIGDPKVRPDADMGYQASLSAKNERPKEGNFGAGTGATVGKIFGPGQAMKAGIGTSSVSAGNGIIVAAMVVVNAFGDIFDPVKGRLIAGARAFTLDGSKTTLANTLETMKGFTGRTAFSFASGSNTVIGVVATNAFLSKEEANKVAQMAQDGIATAVKPAHTMLDGDTLFCLSYGRKRANVSIVGAFAAIAVEKAILSGTLSAKTVGKIPAASSLAFNQDP